MLASVLLRFYENKVPHAKLLGNVVGGCISVYVFVLLVEWQKNKNKYENDAAIYGYAFEEPRS
jgi:hypothetical protein